MVRVQDGARKPDVFWGLLGFFDMLAGGVLADGFISSIRVFLFCLEGTDSGFGDKAGGREMVRGARGPLEASLGVAISRERSKDVCASILCKANSTKWTIESASSLGYCDSNRKTNRRGTV